MKIRLNNHGMGLLSILLALAIIGLVFFFAAKNNQNTSQSSYFKQTGLDASNYKRTLDSTKKVLNEAQKTRMDIP